MLNAFRRRGDRDATVSLVLYARSAVLNAFRRRGDRDCSGSPYRHLAIVCSTPFGDEAIGTLYGLLAPRPVWKCSTPFGDEAIGTFQSANISGGVLCAQRLSATRRSGPYVIEGRDGLYLYRAQRLSATRRSGLGTSDLRQRPDRRVLNAFRRRGDRDLSLSKVRQIEEKDASFDHAL